MTEVLISFAWFFFFFNNVDVEGSRNTIFEKNVARSEKLNDIKAARISITFQDQDIHLLGTFSPSPFIPSQILLQKGYHTSLHRGPGGGTNVEGSNGMQFEGCLCYKCGM